LIFAAVVAVALPYYTYQERENIVNDAGHPADSSTVIDEGSLHEWLEVRGYTRIHLESSAIGHFYTQGAINAMAVHVLVDTGAARTVFDLTWIKGRGIETELTPQLGGGAGSAMMTVYSVKGVVLEIGGCKIDGADFAAVDLSHVTENLQKRGIPAPQVILGADVMQSRRAIVDYGSKSLFLRLV
jgi:predicted aspartyl protease